MKPIDIIDFAKKHGIQVKWEDIDSVKSQIDKDNSIWIVVNPNLLKSDQRALIAYAILKIQNGEMDINYDTDNENEKKYWRKKVAELLMPSTEVDKFYKKMRTNNMAVNEIKLAAKYQVPWNYARIRIKELENKQK